jgi:putative ABC transport system permease protein
MNLARLSLANLRANRLWAALNLLMLALGLGTITLLLLVSHQLSERMVRDAQGIDLVVGAKGSPLQLILSAIYHVDIPTGNIPLADAERWSAHPLVRRAIPLALGDSYNDFRIVGSTHAYVELYGGRVAAGRMWHETMEAVIGAEVARRERLRIGDRIIGAHGFVDGGLQHKDTPYTIVGILARTGTVLDRLIVGSVESVWAIHEPAAPAPARPPGMPDMPAHDAHLVRGEITALLLTYASPLAAATLPRQINAETALQAASPAFESARLFRLVGFGLDAMRVLAGVLVAGAALGLFVALWNAMRERRYDLAIMRTLGASRLRLLAAVLLEGVALALAGALGGLLLGHLSAELLGWSSETLRELGVTGRILLAGELWIVALALATGALAALLPAVLAYRLDVAEVLASGRG